jgi:cytochrome c-type biogenesis protein CcmH/NrfF
MCVVLPFRARFGRGAFWMKSAQTLLLAVAVCFSMGATTDAGSRMDNLSHQLMCQCGCAQILGECDHVGCPSRGNELADLNTDIASGASDKQIMNLFAAKYGEIVLAAPRTQGFGLVAWIAPFAVFLAALMGTILLIRRWGGLRGFKPQPTAADDSAALTPEERARREQIRRETEQDGGR